MALSNTDRWVVLRLRGDGETAWLEYADSSGRQRRPTSALRGDVPEWPVRLVFSPRAGWVSIALRVPADFDQLLNEAMATLPMRYGLHANGPAPLAIFFVRPARLRSIEPKADVLEWPWSDWEWAVRDILLRGFDHDRIEVVRLERQRWRPRPRLRLPLRLLAVGDLADAALMNLRDRRWYLDSAETQQFGMQLTTVNLKEVAATLRATPYDLVIGDDQSAAQVLRAAARLPQPGLSRPRLVIQLSASHQLSESDIAPLPPGMSLLRLRATNPVDVALFMKDFVYGIIHDYPLHEALKAAKRKAHRVHQMDPALPDHARLIADPASNNDLRLSEALAGLQEETFTVSQTAARGDLQAFLARMGADAPPPLRARLEKAFAPHDSVRKTVDQMRWLKLNFQQEDEGLVRMSQTEAAMDEAKQSADSIKAALSDFFDKPDYVEAMRKYQERRVDVALESLNAMAVYLPVSPQVKLKRGERYRLRVHIGQRADGSLVVGGVPPLDPLLPENEKRGHTLEVVVFEKDFTLTGPRVQSLYLPLLGGTSPVYFDLRAPAGETAELRLGIYHQNNLLQSFVLTARVGTGEYVGGADPQVAVRLTFSRTARFTNLNKLGERALSIGANDDLNAGNHTFTLKRNGQAMGLRLTEKILTEQTRVFRSILEHATYDEYGHPRFLTVPVPPATAPANPPPFSEAFAGVIRELADHGRSLYQSIVVRAPKALREELRGLATTTDETIQVVRHDATFVFPWPVLYDFALPPRIAGAPPAPVCLGGMNGAAGNWAKSCAHGPQNPGYCVYGFWAVRHRVEQLVQLGDELRDDDPHVQANPNAAVCFAVDQPDTHTQQMVDAVRQKLSAAVELSANDDLLQLLWESQKRPTLLIVLGHLETQTISGEPEGARIVLQPKKQWLQAAGITQQQTQNGDWDPQPQTLVLLMACGSATTDIGTLNDFFTALRVAGATAIVGTECTAFTGLVAHFAKEVTLAIWDGKSLGDAVKLFNRRLIATGNPLAFVFTYLGDADLKVVG